MNTLVPGAPQAIQPEANGTAPIALGRARAPTLPAAQAQPLTQEAVLLGALHEATEVTKAVRTAVSAGKFGPWAGVILSALLWGAHMLTGDRALLDRLEALEEAEDDRLEHDQWVVQALQALSKGEPLPDYPIPRRRRKLDR